MRSFRAVAMLAVACTAFASAPTARAADVTVFAAASLKEAMDEQTRGFEAARGDKVIVSYGASSALAKQIEAGAPADLFISADLDWIGYLDERKLLAPDTRGNLLRNTLVLVAPASKPSNLRIAPRFDLAGALGAEKLAIANPDGVPAGKYARSALEALGVWSSVERNVVRAENVRAALALVARGEARFGIVYATDALAERGVVVVDTFASDTHPPIVYPVAVVAASRSPAARPLLEYLRSAAASAIWEKHGFGMASAALGHDVRGLTKP